MGFANDCATATISPDYFIVGKGLEGGPGLRWRAAELGFQSGLSAGTIGGAVCLFLRPKRLGFSWRQCFEMMRMLWVPLVAALACGWLMPLFAGRADPMKFASTLTPLLSTEQLAKFTQVWWTHTGIYAGLIVGLAVVIALQFREKSP